jgi:hypothetical protein
MVISKVLDLVATPQEFPIPGGADGSAQLTIAFTSLPSAGTVSVQYRRPGTTAWLSLSKFTSLSLTAGPVSGRVDGPVSAVRITFTGLVGGAAPIAWMDTDSTPSGLYSGLAAMTTQGYAEANVKNGVQFDMRASWGLFNVSPGTGGVIPAGAVRKILFQTGAKTVLIKLRELQYIAEEVVLRLFRAPTGVTGGTPLSINNYNARNPVASTVSATKNVTTTTDGTEFNGTDPEVFFGSTNNPQRNQATALQGRERLLLPNTTYLVTIANTGSGDARVEYHLDWYEGDTDLPL